MAIPVAGRILQRCKNEKIQRRLSIYLMSTLEGNALTHTFLLPTQVPEFVHNQEPPKREDPSITVKLLNLLTHFLRSGNIIHIALAIQLLIPFREYHHHRAAHRKVTNRKYLDQICNMRMLSLVRMNSIGSDHRKELRYKTETKDVSERIRD